ncbi:MAG: MarR family winged helix-turn-helix transcriptional regulator [bacterium]|nr:MarR family winged helix-turn-helix transcriptional regulator [bacterium]
MGNLDDISDKIMILGAKVYPLFRQIFENYHPDEIAILHILRMADGKLVRKELLKELNVEKKIISRRIRNLVSMGFVKSYRSQLSAREVVDEITEKGNREFNDLRKKIKFLLKGGMEFLDKEEQRVLQNIINQSGNKIKTIEKIVKLGVK